MVLNQNEKDAAKRENLRENSVEEQELQETSHEVKEAPLREKEQDDVVVHRLHQEIEKIDADDALKLQAQNQAQQAKLLQEKEQLDHLLSLAKEKGVVYAVSVAQKMNDAYILDKLHDMLSENGFYEHLTK